MQGPGLLLYVRDVFILTPPTGEPDFPTHPTVGDEFSDIFDCRGCTSNVGNGPSSVGNVSLTSPTVGKGFLTVRDGPLTPPTVGNGPLTVANGSLTSLVIGEGPLTFSDGYPRPPIVCKLYVDIADMSPNMLYIDR